MRFVSLLASGIFMAALTPTAHADRESCRTMLLEAPVDELYQILQIGSMQAAQIRSIRNDLSRRRAALEVHPDLYHQDGLSSQLETVSILALNQVKNLLTPWQLGRCNGEPYHRPGPVVVMRYVPRRVARPAPWPVQRLAPHPVTDRRPRVVHRVPRVTDRGPRVVHRAPRVTDRGPRVVRRAPRVTDRGPRVVRRAAPVVRHRRPSLDKDRKPSRAARNNCPVSSRDHAPAQPRKRR